MLLAELEFVRMRSLRRAFSLIEILVVLGIIGLLVALGVGAFNRYQANTALNQGANRLTQELIALQTTARTSGQPQIRGGSDLTVALPEAANVDARGVIECRVSEGSELGIRAVKRFELIPASIRHLHIRTTNLPDRPLENPMADTGLVAEVGWTPAGSAGYTRLFTILFNPDGGVLLPLDDQPGRIILSNGFRERVIEVSRSGRIREMP